MRPSYTLVKVKNYWYYYVYDVKGKRCRYSTRQTTRTAANAYCLDLLRDNKLIPGRIEKISFNEFSQPFWVWETCPIVTDKIERGYRFSKTLCKNHRGCMERNILPTFGRYLLTDITPDMINRWLLGMRHPRKVKGKDYPPLANSTANKMYRMLKEMLNIALRQGLIDSNPAESVPKLADNHTKRGCYTLNEAELILTEKSEWPSILAWLGSYTAALTGMRMGEIRALRASDIKDDYIFVQHSYDVTVGLKATKAEKARYVPIPPNLKRELLAFAPVCGFIFSLDGGVTPISPSYLLRNLYWRMDDLGIDYKSKRLTFHSWRHFFNTQLIAAGVSGEITRAVVGHESADMTAHYLHLTTDEMEQIKVVQKSLI